MVALRAGWIPPVLANYVAHAWMAGIALTWFFLLGRRFPIGNFNRRMRPWYIVALVLIAVKWEKRLRRCPQRGCIFLACQP